MKPGNWKCCVNDRFYQHFLIFVCAQHPQKCWNRVKASGFISFFAFSGGHILSLMRPDPSSNEFPAPGTPFCEFPAPGKSFCKFPVLDMLFSEFPAPGTQFCEFPAPDTTL